MPKNGSWYDTSESDPMDEEELILQTPLGGANAGWPLRPIGRHR